MRLSRSLSDLQMKSDLFSQLTFGKLAHDLRFTHREACGQFGVANHIFILTFSAQRAADEL